MSFGTNWRDISYANNSITGNSGTDYRITVTSGAGTATSVSVPIYEHGDVEINPSVGHQSRIEKRISPKLYFSYVKSKLQKSELKALQIRLGKLQNLTKDAFDIRQQGLYEEYAKLIAIAVRESEAVVCGYDRFVEQKDIDKFMSITKESGAKKSPVYFKKLEEFPRSIPFKVKEVIKAVQTKQVFDQLWVLYLDYVGVELKTNKEKIREKDPVVFGQFAYDKTRFFFITDWVDEHCDLTLNEFISKIRTQDQDYNTETIPDIDNAFLRKIRKEVDERQARLDQTNSKNFRTLMSQEDKKKPWYKRMWGK